jgi:hypothetical protein
MVQGIQCVDEGESGVLTSQQGGKQRDVLEKPKFKKIFSFACTQQPLALVSRRHPIRISINFS